MQATDSGYAQVGGSSSSGNGETCMEKGQRNDRVGDGWNESVQVEKHGGDHSEEAIGSQEKRRRFDGEVWQGLGDTSALDREIMEHGISELRSQSVGCEASRALAAIEV